MLSKRGAVAALLFTALVPGVTGCSGPADDGTHTPSTASATAAATATEPAVRPIETATPVAFDRDAPKAKARNEIGEPWRLDAAGATACARAEFAFRSPETGGDLAGQLEQLRSAVKKTKSTSLRDAVAALPAGAAATDVRSVLEVCTAMGYQL
ncbi:hypothetical protein [Kineosporia sp. R_H_3]|uniref:hypothetical protein n=1 Tax=Kineosporia sp. R_H_3 TaxID=1961848 RepID=UPI000B4AA53B|nr:hypothetical protein [Kineosporia sp. R_H_3]